MSKIKKYLAALLTLALMASACAAGISMTASAVPGDYPSADEIYEDVNTLKEVYSPNGELFMSFWLSSAGEAYYEVVYKGIRVVKNSKLGLRLDYGTLDSGFELISTATSANNSSWNDPLNQMAVIPDKYNELTVSLRSGDTDVNMIFCAYNDGAALKYSFPQTNTRTAFVINEELTYFNLDNSATAYAHLGGNQTHVNKTPVTSLSASTDGYFRPLIVIGSGYTMTLTEAHQVDYTRVHFTKDPASPAGTLCTLFNGTHTNSSLDAS